MLKLPLLLVIIFSANSLLFSQSNAVGIGTSTPHSSAILEIQSTTKGVLVPRMTTTQRNAISNAATGLWYLTIAPDLFGLKEQPTG